MEARKAMMATMFGSWQAVGELLMMQVSVSVSSVFSASTCQAWLEIQPNTITENS